MANKLSSKMEEARNIFLGFSESLVKDPEMVDEYLLDEGYNLDDIDKEGLELLRKIEFACKISETSIKKHSLFDQAKAYALDLIEKATSGSTSVLGNSQEQALRLALHRDFKELSLEDIESIMHNQTILSFLEGNQKNINDSDEKSSTSRT